MSKRRVKQQNVSVTGLFKLAGRHMKTNDVFVTTYVRAQPKLTLQKIKNTQTQSQTTLVTCLLLCLLVCLFFLCAFPIRFV